MPRSWTATSRRSTTCMCGPTASTSTSAWRRPNPASWCSSGSAPTARRNWSRSRTYRESAESWADLMRDCARRGMRAPVLAVGDGALGFWKALAKVFPETHLAPFPAHRAGGRPTGPQTGKTLSCVLATTIPDTCADPRIRLAKDSAVPSRRDVSQPDTRPDFPASGTGRKAPGRLAAPRPRCNGGRGDGRDDRLSGVLVMDPRTQILRPLQRPRLEFFDLSGGEPVRGVVLILVPVRADEPVPEVFEADSSWARRRPRDSRSAVERWWEAAWTSMRSRTVPRSARARTLVPITSSRERTGP